MKIHNYSFKNFKPKIISDLVRLGNKNKDGGYLLSKRQIGLTNVLIGLGIHYDWTFEEEFKTERKDLLIHGYDFSIGKGEYIKGFITSILDILSPVTYTNILFRKAKPKTVFTRPFLELGTYFKFGSFFDPKKKNFFFQEGVSDHTDNVFITINEVFKRIPEFDKLPDNSVFIKMDIEGSEYDILEDILKQQAKINGMIIEFHSIKRAWNEFSYIMDEIKKHYEIIHLHGNNCCGYIVDTEIPNLIELSLIKRELLSADELSAVNNKSYPLELDQPNVANKPDLKISFQ